MNVSLAGSFPNADEAPPSLPAEHFAAALASFACGALGLVWIAPDLAAGRFFLPRVVAVVHLFTLGWIIPSIFGALCQFLPVAVGRPVRSIAAAHVSFAAQLGGVTSLVVGLLGDARPLLHLGATLLSIAFVTFAVNLAATLAQVKQRTLTFWALAGAAVFLVVTPAFGVLLAANLHHPGLVADRFLTIGEHAHIALVGVVFLTMIGVAHHLVPMFLLSHGASEWPGRIAAILAFACASTLAVPLGTAVRLVVAGALGSAAVVAFAVQAALFFRHRKRRNVDPGMRLAGAGVGGLLVAVLLAPLSLGRGLADLQSLTTYFVVLLGSVSLFVAGHYYKVVPFLVWYHRFGPLVGTRKVPNVAELYSANVAKVDALLLGAGLAGLALSVFFGVAAAARLSAMVFAAGALLEVAVIAQVARRRLA